MSGVGKSSIGKKISKKLGLEFIDLDVSLRHRFHVDFLQDILEKMGENAFILEEEKEVLRLPFDHPVVISPGGSVVYSSEAMRYLQEHSVIIYLYDSYDAIYSRIQDNHTRGIVWKGETSFENLYRGREPLYRQYANIIIDLGPAFHLDTIVERVMISLEDYDRDSVT